MSGNEFSSLYQSLPATSQDALAFALRILTAARSVEQAPAQTQIAAPTAVVPSIVAPTLSCERRRPSNLPARIAKLRDRLVRDLWEVDLSSQLIDRAIALVVAREVTTKELEAAVNMANERRQQYDKTGRGSDRRWKVFAAIVKGWTERAGREWTPCAGPLERKPETRVQIVVER